MMFPLTISEFTLHRLRRYGPCADAIPFGDGTFQVRFTRPWTESELNHLLNQVETRKCASTTS